MAMILMQHEKHGYMPVYSEHEVAYNEKSGWKRATAPASAPPTVPPVEPAKPEPTPTERYRLKFGRPPNIRMTTQQIESALRE